MGCSRVNGGVDSRRIVRGVVLTDNTRFVRSVTEALSAAGNDGDKFVGTKVRTGMTTKHGGLDVSIVQIDCQ
jgi:hypothetical protein